MGYAEFIALMALIMSTVALSTDAVLPALPMIGDALGTVDENSRQLVVGVLFLGLAVSQALFGPLSDSLGRKPIIYLGFGLFAFGSLISIWATSFDMMLIGRFVQGFGAAAPRVISVAIIRDRFEGRQMAKTTSLIMTIFILVPVFAPAVGQLILTFAHWHGIFWLFIVMAAATALWVGRRLPETLPPERRYPLSFRRVGSAFREVVSHRMAMGYLLAAASLLSALIGYVTSAQQILQDLYGLGELFPVAFGALASSLGLASFVNSRTVTSLGVRKTIRMALTAMIVLTAASATSAFLYDGLPPLWLVFMFFVPMFFCLGMLFGNMNALAMQPMGHIAGSAAAVIGTGTTALSAMLGSLVGQAFDGTILPLAVSFLVFTVLALVFSVWAER